MLDTVVLTLNQASFKILNHNRFSPSTEGLFNPSRYYRLGGRANLTCVQNPTSSELRNGIYKPRLTVSKRINKHSEFEITLKIEFSAPKLLFGNNFDELEDSDFSQIISKLKQKLADMGVHVPEPILAHAPISAIHYSKNIPLTDYSSPYAYLEQLSKINLNQRLDLNQTDFRNEGHSLKYRANSFEVVFYDKLKDLRKAKISEKRSEEKDNAIQLHLFDKVEIKKPFEVLRMEARLNRRQKIKQVLRHSGIVIEPTFQALFNKEVAQKVLLFYISEVEKCYPSLLSYNAKDPKNFMSAFIIHNPKVGLKKALQMLGLRLLLDQVGVREFREIIAKYGKANWYRLNRETQYLNYPEREQAFMVIQRCLKEFKPLKLLDFQEAECKIM